MISRFNDAVRPWLVIATCRVATPFSIAVHSVLYLGWWVSGVGEMALAIAMSLEAIVIGLVIIDKQNSEAARDHEWQKQVFQELLDKIEGARPEVADLD